MSAPSTPPPALPVGHLIAGRYRVLRLLGQGGMGAVYEAEHVELRRRVAVKMLLPAVATDPEIVARFFREARAAASIGHPGIVEVFDLGHDEKLAFLVMEKLEGEELAERVHRDHPLGVVEVAKIGIELADAVGAAHEHGIVHRDLKPQNVFLAKRPRGASVVKVLDFGIAKLLDPELAPETPLTETGRVFGTPLYMAPEQLRSTASVDARADVYALGVVLYETLAGAPPFGGGSYPELILEICTGAAKPLRDVRADVPEALATIIARAMAMNAADRYPHARALADALEKFVRDHGSDPGLALARTMPSVAPAPLPEPPTPDRRAWFAAAGLGIALVVGVGWTIDHGAAPVTQAPATMIATVDAAVLAPVRDDAAPARVADPPAHDLHVVATPAGADVASSDGAHCLAPCTLPDVDAPVTLTVSHAGYVTETVPVDPAMQSELEVHLRRRERSHDDDPPPLHGP